MYEMLCGRFFSNSNSNWLQIAIVATNLIKCKLIAGLIQLQDFMDVVKFEPEPSIIKVLLVVPTVLKAYTIN